MLICQNIKTFFDGLFSYYKFKMTDLHLMIERLKFVRIISIQLAINLEFLRFRLMTWWSKRPVYLDWTVTSRLDYLDRIKTIRGYRNLLRLNIKPVFVVRRVALTGR